LGNLVIWDMHFAIFCCGMGLLAVTFGLSGVPGYWTVLFILDVYVVYY